MKKTKQFLLQNRDMMALILFIGAIIFTIWGVINLLNTPSASFKDFFIPFSGFFLMPTLFGIALMFSLTPYREKIAEKIKIKDSVIELPQLYSFAVINQITVSFLNDEEVKNIVKEETDKKYFFQRLDLEKIEIKLLDKEKNELRVELHESSSKTKNINISLVDKKEIEKAAYLSIKSEFELESDITYVSYDPK